VTPRDRVTWAPRFANFDRRCNRRDPDLQRVQNDGDAQARGHRFSYRSRIRPPIDSLASSSFRWDYTTYLNIIFIVAGVALLLRLFRTGVAMMLKMMGTTSEPADLGSR
jgi:hypothetical protein